MITSAQLLYKFPVYNFRSVADLRWNRAVEKIDRIKSSLAI